MSEVIGRVKYRRPLNKQQVRTLFILYWYRFCTSKQIAVSLKRSDPKSIQNKLKILEDQGLISKRYDKNYKLAGRPAEYYITPKGARALEVAQPDTTNQWATKSLYENQTVSDEFLKHTITVVDVAQRLRALYDNKPWILPKSYMAKYSVYPTWAPDLHIKIPMRGETPTKHYFLDIWDGSKPFFVSVRKTRNYVNFKESGDWEEEEDEAFPVVLAICNDPNAQKKLNRQMKHILYNDWDGGLIFATTTIQQLEAATQPAEKIWLKIDADYEAELVSFKQLAPDNEK